MNKTMKKYQSLKGAGAALSALLLVGLATSAKAVLFQNITPGDLVFKIADFDSGTLYNTQLLNGTLGTTNNPATGASALAGQLDSPGAVFAQAAGAHAIATFGNNLEDSWGIATVTQIFNANNLVTPVWSSTIDNQQLTVMFYGSQDFFLKQVSIGGGILDSQTIDSVGLNVDLYLQDNANGSFTSFNQALGPAGRPADVAGLTKANDASYQTVTDSNGTTFTLGVPVLTTKSTAGFLRALNDLGGPATEFETTFNGSAANGAGSGATFLSVTPTLGGVGTFNALYDTNSFAAPHIAGNTADFSVQFTTTTQGTGASGWLLSSQDPIRGRIIPEPTTGIMGLACMLPVLMRGLARRRKSLEANTVTA